MPKTVRKHMRNVGFIDPEKMRTTIGRLRVLRDGRLIATGFSPMTPEEKARAAGGRKPAICVSADGGYTWSEPIIVLPEM